MPKAPLSFDLPDSGATEALGASLAKTFPGADSGAIVHLRGELGSGKTTCARSLLHAIGVTAPVRSPTYTLVDTYSVAGMTCVHVDLYRVQTGTEVEELGLRDMTGPGYLMLIEWPEKGGVAVPPADLLLQLNYNGEARSAALGAASATGSDWLSRLAIDTSLVPYVSNLA
ncbi:MAG: tRNA (adenosine(37)-N6)-threonylcarbamoyltransferase complex ATPase subunit type 1 TsaE [Steroidobacteraceae bacterium]